MRPARNPLSGKVVRGHRRLARHRCRHSAKLCRRRQPGRDRLSQWECRRPRQSSARSPRWERKAWPSPVTSRNPRMVRQWFAQVVARFGHTRCAGELRRPSRSTGLSKRATPLSSMPSSTPMCLGTVTMIQAVLPASDRPRAGRIINFSSGLATRPIPTTSIYAASQSGGRRAVACAGRKNSGRAASPSIPSRPVSSRPT